MAEAARGQDGGAGLKQAEGMRPGSDEGEDEGERECRICHASEGANGEWISPCRCKGFSRWVHKECLQRWRVSSKRPESFDACELCQCTYRVSHVWWVRYLESKPLLLWWTVAIMVICIALGILVWEGFAYFFFWFCDNPMESFRFSINVFGFNLGFLFGGVVMLKLGVIVLQLFRQDTPEVQNMVGFLAFIVFLVQSRVFSPEPFHPVEGKKGEWATGGVMSETFKDLLYWAGFVPHYFLVVYTLTTTRWVYEMVKMGSQAALRRGSVVVSYDAGAGGEKKVQ